MLGRLARALAACSASPDGRAAVAALLAELPRGPELLVIDSLLADCRVQKLGGRLSSVAEA
jgi:hypothetical protein